MNDPVSTDPRPSRSLLWVLLTVAAPLLACWDGLTTSRVFYIRDLSFYYWPIHRWARNAYLSGNFPLWDPYPAFGQPAIAEAARQLLFPPAILFRALLPETLGFNLFVAAAFPVAAAGMFFFLRRHGSHAAAALGALVFALSGPVLSLGNMPNHSWTLAFTPWAFLAVEWAATGARRHAVLLMAGATAMQALAGEPVTLAFTSGLCLVYAAVVSFDAGWKRAAANAAYIFVSSLAGFALAAVQMLPLLDTVAGSLRGKVSANALPIHPLSLLETLVWPLFDNPFNNWGSSAPWLTALYGGPDPYFFALYVGIGALAIAAAGALACWRTRRAAFWIVSLLVMIVFAFGTHTPIYPAVREILPVLALFRYPAKYLCFAVLALAVLSAIGWDALSSEAHSRVARIAAVAVAGAVAAGAALAWVAAMDGESGPFASLAVAVGAADPAIAAAALSENVASAAPRLLALALAVAACVFLSARMLERSKLLLGALFLLAVADPFTVNSAVNPAFDASLLGAPAWAERTHADPAARTYLPGRVDFYFGEGKEEGYGQADPVLRQLTSQQASAITNTRYVAFPADARVREAISMDLTSVWPERYKLAIIRYGYSAGGDRIRFLERAGVRYFLLGGPPPGGTPIGQVPGSSLTLYERPGASPRATVATEARVEPDPELQIDAFFRADVDPARTVLLDAEPPAPAGLAGAPQPASATLVEDGSARVRVSASAPEGGGYLLLRDSWSPYWKVEVDGEPAELLRAYNVFRAVRLAPGQHDVVFTYRPQPFYTGAIVSTVTLVALLAYFFWGFARDRRAARAA